MATARSRGLGVEVRKLRKSAGLRLEELAERCGWSRATFGRIESGDKVPSETEIAIILGTLGVTGLDRTRLLELAQNAHQPQWWEVGNKKLPAQLVTLMECERIATRICDVELALVPGLLQTVDYSRAVIGAGGMSAEELESRVSLRLGRQSALTRGDRAEFHGILDESVIRRPIGSAEVMRDQLRHIVSLCRRPNITVQILPFEVGAHVGLNGSQRTFEFQRQRSVVYLEHRRSGVFLDEESETAPYFEAARVLAEQALNSRESIELIEARIADWEQGCGDERNVA